MERKSPLAWPADEPRTPPGRRQAKSLFSTTVSKTLDQLERELLRFRAKNIVLSIELPFRGKVNDSAAALFFDLPGARKIAICCDLYVKQEDNLRAIYMVIEAMRTIERYGGQHLSQKSFTGFAALPPPKDVWSILGLNKELGKQLSPKMRREYVMEAFRERAKEGHAKGADMAELVDAKEHALKELGVADAG